MAEKKAGVAEWFRRYLSGGAAGKAEGAATKRNKEIEHIAEELKDKPAKKDNAEKIIKGYRHIK